MSQNSGSNIHIKKIKGNVVISQNQDGGITAEELNVSNTISPKKKKSIIKKVGLWAALILPILGILAFFGIQPKSKENKIQTQESALPSLTHIGSQPHSKKGVYLKDSIKNKKPYLRKKAMQNNEEKSDKPISLGNVKGDVVISQNQKGGITAHTVIQNSYGIAQPQRYINDNDINKLTSIMPDKKEYDISITYPINDKESRLYGENMGQALSDLGYHIMFVTGASVYRSGEPRDILRRFETNYTKGIRDFSITIISLNE